MAIPPPAPLPHPLWQNLPMCPVTGSSEDGSHGTTCLLVVLGSRKISSELGDRDLAGRRALKIWHPGGIELRWHIYVWPLSVEGDLPLKYRSREISSKQYGAGQCQQISDVFLKQGIGHFFKLSGIAPKLRQGDAEVFCASIGYRFAWCQFCSFVYFNDDQETKSMYGFSNSWLWYPISARAPR